MKKNGEWNQNMEMTPSKRRILEEALRLFSTNGFEATSIEQITNAVNIRKASFYSHFSSKQEIFDTLLEEIKERYAVYAETVFKKHQITELYYNKSTQLIAQDVFNSIKQELEFLIYDPFFSMARNFLTIEQFRHPQLASIQNQCEYIDALNYHKQIIQHLVKNKILLDKGIEIMAYEFFSPIFVQFYHIQKEPKCKEEAMKIVEQHIHHFFMIYSK